MYGQTKREADPKVGTDKERARSKAIQGGATATTDETAKRKPRRRQLQSSN